MKSREYIKQMKNIQPSEELIQKTISKVQQAEEVKNMNKRFNFKKVIAGIATILTLSVGTVAAYVAITGNTEILEKIGIKLSQNYEENQQNITKSNSEKSKFTVDGAEVELVSVALDNMNIVMEFNLKIDEKYDVQFPDLNVSQIEINVPSKEMPIGEGLEFSQKQSAKMMEDGTYKIFKYVSVIDPALAINNFWNTMFEFDEKINCKIGFSGLYDVDKKIVDMEESINYFQFELTKPNNLNDLEDRVVKNETIEYKNVEIFIEGIQKSNFGNIISLIATESNISLDKINDIQKVDFIVKDKNGNKLNVVSRAENITGDCYKNGDLTKVGLEIQLIVDDNESVDDYDIEVVESDKIVVSTEKIREVFDELLDSYKMGDMVLTSDGVSEPIENVNEKDYYIDEYGVYLTNKTAEEICYDNGIALDTNYNEEIDEVDATEWDSIEKFLNEPKNNMIYLKEYSAYYTEGEDEGYVPIYVYAVSKTDDGKYIVTVSNVSEEELEESLEIDFSDIVLEKNGDSYLFISNQ